RNPGSRAIRNRYKPSHRRGKGSRACAGDAKERPDMTLRRFAFIPVVVLVAASIAIALAGPARADVGGRPISVVMTGPAERPGPGDPDGTGTASFTFNPGQDTVCFELAVSNIAPATAAHIHVAPPTD